MLQGVMCYRVLAIDSAMCYRELRFRVLVNVLQ